MAKNKKKKEEEVQVEFNFKNIRKILGYILIILIVLYLITSLFLGEFNFDKDNSNEEEEAEVIQYDEIIAGEIFNLSEKEYYVVIYDFESNEAKTIQYYLDNTFDEDMLNVYKVDLSNGFNKYIKGDNSNIHTSKIEELKITDVTLIKVENKKNVLAIEGFDKIKEFFK